MWAYIRIDPALYKARHRNPSKSVVLQEWYRRTLYRIVNRERWINNSQREADQIKGGACSSLMYTGIYYSAVTIDIVVRRPVNRMLLSTGGRCVQIHT